MATRGARQQISKDEIRAYLHQRNIPFNETFGEITADFDVLTLTGRIYRLRLYIREDFPDARDSITVVVVQNSLLQRNGTAIPQNSTEFRTLGQTRERHQILSIPYSTTSLNAGVFLHQIFVNATQWFNAYEEHVASGISLASHLQECRQIENESPSTPVQFWLDAQVKRLAVEKGMLDQFFGPDHVKWSHDRRSVDVTIKSLQNNTYVLQVHLHHDYPNSCPILAIVRPEVLFQVNGEPLPEFSSEFATLGKKHDRLMICHFGPNEWMDNCRIASVILKGNVWVNAYESYLSQDNASFRECLRHCCQSRHDNN